jgi:replicative DNA helicase
VKDYIRYMEATALASYLYQLEEDPKKREVPNPDRFLSNDYKEIAKILAEGGTYTDVIMKARDTDFQAASIEVLDIPHHLIWPVSALESAIFYNLDQVKKQKETKSAAIAAIQAVKKGDGDKGEAILREFVEREEIHESTKKVGSAIEAARVFVDRQLKRLQGEQLESLIKTSINLFETKINEGLGGGIQTGQIGTIAARPGRGKSSFGFYLVDNAMRANPDLRVCIFSLEMPAPDVAKKFIDQGTIRAGNPREPSLRLATGAREAAPLFERMIIDDDTGQTVDQILAKAREYTKQGVRLFLLDYIQLVNCDGYGAEQLRVAYGDAVRKLTEDAKKNDRAWIILSQFGRSADDRRPVMSDLKETSAIEENSHWILGLHRPYAETGTPGEPRELHPTELEVHVLKNRYGPAGEMVRLVADWRGSTFSEPTF